VKLLKVPDVAEVLACSNATVYALVESGQLPAVKIGAGGGGVRVKPEDLERFIDSRKTVAPSAPRVAKVVTLRHLR
jgi:excisionase family DNA binding protein